MPDARTEKFIHMASLWCIGMMTPPCLAQSSGTCDHDIHHYDKRGAQHSTAQHSAAQHSTCTAHHSTCIRTAQHSSAQHSPAQHSSTAQHSGQRYLVLVIGDRDHGEQAQRRRKGIVFAVLWNPQLSDIPQLAFPISSQSVCRTQPRTRQSMTSTGHQHRTETQFMTAGHEHRNTILILPDMIMSTEIQFVR